MSIMTLKLRSENGTRFSAKIIYYPSLMLKVSALGTNLMMDGSRLTYASHRHLDKTHP